MGKKESSILRIQLTHRPICSLRAIGRRAEAMQDHESPNEAFAGAVATARWQPAKALFLTLSLSLLFTLLSTNPSSLPMSHRTPSDAFPCSNNLYVASEVPFHQKIAPHWWLRAAQVGTIAKVGLRLWHPFSADPGAVLWHVTPISLSGFRLIVFSMHQETCEGTDANGNYVGPR